MNPKDKPYLRLSREKMFYVLESLCGLLVKGKYTDEQGSSIMNYTAFTEACSLLGWPDSVIPAGPATSAAGEDQELAQLLIAETCDQLKAMLLAKNRSYGNSALDPQRIFSTADAKAQIEVRIDDKLSRIRFMREQDKYRRVNGVISVNGEQHVIHDQPQSASSLAQREDAEMDLLGYLVLLIASRRYNP